MATIFGHILNNKKPIYLSLTAIFGIGISRAKKILQMAQINPLTRTAYVSTSKALKIQNIIEDLKYKLDGDLKRDIVFRIKHLVDTRTYRGARHFERMPVRGQRTHSNSKTARKISYYHRYS